MTSKSAELASESAHEAVDSSNKTLSSAQTENEAPLPPSTSEFTAPAEESASATPKVSTDEKNTPSSAESEPSEKPPTAGVPVNEGTEENSSPPLTDELAADSLTSAMSTIEDPTNETIKDEEASPNEPDSAVTESPLVEQSPTSPSATSEVAAEPEAHIVQATWSKLSTEDIIDKIKGVIYGQALGDAIGLATEFMTKADVRKFYGKNGKRLKSFDDICQDFHRSRWEKGDWTDDTDQMLLILLGAIEDKGVIKETTFAEKMVMWMREGFRELGDYGGYGIGMTVFKTITQSRFTTEPHEAAKAVWEESGCYLAANGAVMRTSILGVLNFNDPARVFENTKRICLTTHADPRCLASCVAVTTAISLMLRGEYDLKKKEKLKELIKKSVEAGLESMPEVYREHHGDDMKNYTSASSWAVLELDERESIGYTFKALGAGFFGLEHGVDYWKTIMELTMEAGDADTNAAVCGALLGCKLGYKKLPQDRLKKMPHIKWLDEKVNDFLKLIGLA